MKKSLCILLSVFLFMLSGVIPAFAAPEKANVAILVPEECGETVRYAAQTLREYLLPLCVSVEIVAEDTADVADIIISIGQTKAALSDASSMTDGSYVIKKHDGIVEINGGGTHGYIYGVFRFLRDFAGYRRS